jgi:peptidoglycan/LPS O-acetylase OafA/YrhL
MSNPVPHAPGEWAKKVIHGNYFPHIDGLRSLAVLPVLFYHLWMPLCPAGFMGVDVFFVISGYLICGGIIRDLEVGSFSMKSFYFRRIRRIFPAYFAVVVFVLIAGISLYHWARIIPLAQTALFSAFFSTNIYFWLDIGYFQPHAHGNPLLHLWSLGVEEQFYIIIPIALLTLWKIRRTSLVPALVVAFAASLLLCLVLGHKGQSTTAFYILPTRGWELLAGALLATRSPAKPSLVSTLLSIIGFLLIAASYWCFSTEKTFRLGGTGVEILLPFFGSLGFAPFPGWVTLPAVAGSLLLLRYGSHGLSTKLLCSPLLVGIGKISYSLYLWH